MDERIYPSTDKPSITLGVALHSYLSNLESMEDCWRNLMPTIEDVEKARAEDISTYFAKILEDHNLESIADEQTFDVPLPPAYLFEFPRRLRDIQKLGMYRKITSTSLFIGMFALYDAFVAELLQSIFFARPEIIRSSERSLTLRELRELGDLNEAEKFIINQEVETVLRGGYDDQFNYMDKKFSVELRKNWAVWPEFVEISQRRHLLVHCAGKVTRSYLYVCDKHGVRWPDNSAPQLGSQLGIDFQYFIRSIEVVYEVGLKVCQILWRKLFPSDLDIADIQLIQNIYELLVNEQWERAIMSGSLALSMPRYSSELYKRTLLLNLAQAYKWSGNNDRAIELLDGDWSACGNEIQLMLAVIRDDYDTACNIMSKIGTSGQVSERDYRDWPAFRQFRQSEQFKSTYEAIFGKTIFDSIVEATPEILPIIVSLRIRKRGGIESTESVE
jgi:hypothetical protein